MFAKKNLDISLGRERKNEKTRPGVGRVDRGDTKKASASKGKGSIDSSRGGTENRGGGKDRERCGKGANDQTDPACSKNWKHNPGGKRVKNARSKRQQEKGTEELT